MCITLNQTDISQQAGPAFQYFWQLQALHAFFTKILAKMSQNFHTLFVNFLEKQLSLLFMCTSEVSF